MKNPEGPVPEIPAPTAMLVQGVLSEGIKTPAVRVCRARLTKNKALSDRPAGAHRLPYRGETVKDQAGEIRSVVPGILA